MNIFGRTWRGVHLAGLLILITFSTAFPQSLISRCETEMSATCNFSGNADSASSVNEEVLRELAKEHLLDIPKVKLDVAVTTVMEVTRGADGEIMASVHLKDPRVTGHTRYRQFDLAGFLVPSAITAELFRCSGKDPARRHLLMSRTAGVREGEALIEPMPVSRFDPGTDTLTLHLSSPCFDTADLRRLRDRIALVDDYYASVSLLDSLEIRANKIRFDSAGMLPYNFCDILEISRAVELIVSRDFDHTLLSGGYDPLGLKQKRKAVYRLSRTLIFDFLDEMEKPGITGPLKDPLAGADYFVDGMIRYIRLSAWMNDIRGNIYRDYLDHYFSVSSFNNDKILFRKLLMKMYGADNPDTLLTFVSDKIFSVYKTKTGELIRQNRQAEAFELIRNARLFRDHVPWLRDRDGTDALMAEAALGVYESYLGIASSCISQRKFSMAEQYLAKALEYKRNNEAWFRTDTLYAGVLKALFRQRLHHCDQLVVPGQYQEAINCYAEFETHYGPEQMELVQPWITERIDTARKLLFLEQERAMTGLLGKKNYDSAFVVYDRLEATFGYLEKDTSAVRRFDGISRIFLPEKLRISTERASYAMALMDYDQAWTWFFQAAQVAEKLGIQPDPAFRERQRAAFRHFQLDEIETASRYIWNDQFDSAYSYIDRVEKKLARYDLSADSVLLPAIDRYKRKISERICANGGSEAEIWLLRAAANVEDKRFVPAVEQFKKVSELMMVHSSCGFPWTGVNDSIEKYSPAACYQSCFDTLRTCVAMGDFDRVTGLLQWMSDLYGHDDLGRFGLDSLSARDYIREQNIPGLTQAAIRKMIGQQLTGEAWFYLEWWHQQGTPVDQTLELQSALGIQLAEGQRSAGAVKPDRDRIREMTGGDQWYRPFTKAYYRSLRVNRKFFNFVSTHLNFKPTTQKPIS